MISKNPKIENSDADDSQEPAKRRLTFSIDNILDNEEKKQKPSSDCDTTTGSNGTSSNQSQQDSVTCTSHPVLTAHSYVQPMSIFPALTKEDYDRLRERTSSELLHQSLEIALLTSRTSERRLEQHHQQQHQLHNDVSSEHAWPALTASSRCVSPDSSRQSETPSRSSSTCDVESTSRRKKARTSFTGQQLRELETRYLTQRYIAAAERVALARRLGLADQQVRAWQCIN